MNGFAKAAATLACYLTLLYLLPTMLERIILLQFGPWVACVVFGDLVGCVFLFVILRMRLLAIVLYFSLMLADVVMLKTHLVSLRVLPWVTDLVPALTVGTICIVSGAILVRHTARADFFSYEFDEY